MINEDRWWRSLSDIYDRVITAEPDITWAERDAIDEFMALQRRTDPPSEETHDG